MKKNGFYILKFLAAACLLYFLSSFIYIKGSLVYAACIPFMALAMFISMASAVTEKKKASLYKYNREGIIYKFLKRRTVSYIFTGLISVFLSFFILVKLFLLSNIEKAALLIIIPIYIFVSFVAKKVALKIYSDIYRANGIKRISYGFSAVIAGILYPFVLYFTGNYQGGASSLQDISNVAFIALAPLENNPIAYVVGYFISFGDSLFIFLTQASSATSPYIIVLILTLFAGNGLFFYGILHYFGAFTLKKDELKAINTPLEHENNEKGVNKFVTAFISVLVIFFIYPSLFAFIQGEVKARSDTFDYVKAKTATVVEIIDGIAYKEGTLRQIELIKSPLFEEDRQELERAVNAAYDEMVINSDKYLDWYYSLGAEYGRIYELITGSIEEYMQAKLQRTLAPSQGLIDVFKTVQENAIKAEKEIEKILQQNKMTVQDGKYRVSINTSLEDIYKQTEIQNIVSLKERLFVSTGVSLAAGAISGTIASKIAAKTAFKTASKAAAKFAAQKGVSAAAGVAAGALSSIFTSPLGGLAVGAAVGVALDKGMLKLEEAVNREDYKNEIIETIEDERRKTLEFIAVSFGDNEE